MNWEAFIVYILIFAVFTPLSWACIDAMHIKAPWDYSAKLGAEAIAIIAVVRIHQIWVGSRAQASSLQPYGKTQQEQELRTRLLAMLSGDHKAALRLLQHVQSANPKRDRVWCLEKVIEDLIRERR